MMKNDIQKKYIASQYMLCVLVEAGHKVIFSPDFNYRFAIPFNQDPHRYTAAALRVVEEEIQNRLDELDRQGSPHPIPKKWKEAIPEHFSVQEAALFLNVSASTLRRMKVPFERTEGGHRRYLKSDLESLDKRY